MSSTPADRYLARFRRVFDFIDAHADEDLCLERLSGIAAFSKFHFQRQFSDSFGISVHKYVRLVRLKRASYALAFRDDSRIVDIALDSGYDGPESFARAFRKNTGQSPSEFRKQPQWLPWHATYEPLGELRSKYMRPNHRIDDGFDRRFRSHESGGARISRRSETVGKLGSHVHRLAQAERLAARREQDVQHRLFASARRRRLALRIVRVDRPVRCRQHVRRGRKDHSGRPLRAAAARRFGRHAAGHRVVPLFAVVTAERRRTARLPAVLPARQSVSGGAGTRSDHRRVICRSLLTDSCTSRRSARSPGRS